MKRRWRGQPPAYYQLAAWLELLEHAHRAVTREGWT